MGCRSREFEMSLSLDGRLPSGRKAALLRHVASCPTCARAWAVAQKAQLLAHAAPQRRLSPAFRAGLEQRIASGEGAPEAIYRAPNPLWSRTQHFVAGAAAAGLAIAIYHFSTLAPPAATGTDLAHAPGDASAMTAAAPPVERSERPVERATRVEPRLEATPATSVTDLRQVSEYDLAVASAEHCVGQARELRRRVSRLKRETAGDPWRDVEPTVTELRTAVDLMRWLERRGMVDLPDPVQKAFGAADHAFGRIDRAASPTERLAGVQSLLEVGLERLRRQRFQIRCCRPAADLVCDLQDLVTIMPEAAKVFSFSTLASNPSVDTLVPNSTRQPFLLLQVRVQRFPTGAPSQTSSDGDRSQTTPRGEGGLRPHRSRRPR
ncbi:MAG: hypothetical protein AAF628_25935 [Planctomycetota bacterium]